MNLFAHNNYFSWIVVKLLDTLELNAPCSDWKHLNGTFHFRLSEKKKQYLWKTFGNKQVN